MKPAPKHPEKAHSVLPSSDELPLAYEQPLGPPPPAKDQAPAPVTTSVEPKPLSVASDSPPAAPKTELSRKASRGQPAKPPAPGQTVKPSAHARHMALNLKKGKVSLHVDIFRRQHERIEALVALTGHSKARIVEEALERGLPRAKRHIRKQLEL